jgi:hypothetical protein
VQFTFVKVVAKFLHRHMLKDLSAVFVLWHRRAVCWRDVNKHFSFSAFISGNELQLK